MNQKQIPTEVLKYELRKIESQIPALLLLKSKKKVCNFLKKSEQSEFISDVQVISDNENLKKISYKDQFGIKTEINFQKIKINEELTKDWNIRNTFTKREVIPLIDRMKRVPMLDEHYSVQIGILIP